MKNKELPLRHRRIVNMPLNMLLFLIRNNALTAFLDNCREYNHLLPDVFESYFQWVFTVEGYEYWSNLRDKYYEQYSE